MNSWVRWTSCGPLVIRNWSNDSIDRIPVIRAAVLSTSHIRITQPGEEWESVRMRELDGMTEKSGLFAQAIRPSRSLVMDGSRAISIPWAWPNRISFVFRF
ncbi:MAG: hypothetical protein CMJ59_00405 [Planctomycetaceae bacterium]|nr:hypothetical protein [Planctomycetaceae bacterium]